MAPTSLAREREARTLDRWPGTTTGRRQDDAAAPAPVLWQRASSSLAVVFVFESTEETEIRFVLPKVRTPLWVALAVTMIIGVVVGFLAAVIARFGGGDVREEITR